jgi:hypothetical protein
MRDATKYIPPYGKSKFLYVISILELSISATASAFRVEIPYRGMRSDTEVVSLAEGTFVPKLYGVDLGRFDDLRAIAAIENDVAPFRSKFSRFFPKKDGTLTRSL